jgi:hypothetical protein
MPPKPPWETSERDTVRLTFDEDAGAYDRARPVAPGYVFDDLGGETSFLGGAAARGRRQDGLTPFPSRKSSTV